jgi:hypothetical protein
MLDTLIHCMPMLTIFQKIKIVIYDHSLINLNDIMFEGEQSYGKLPKVIS